MKISDFAEGLNGREYLNEITPFEEQRAKELGFVVVFGYSDDCAEFRGAIYDEVDCYDGGRIFKYGDKYVDAVWCDGEYSWTYDTNIPHTTFDIYEDGEKFCKGIVFDKRELDYSQISQTEIQCAISEIENVIKDGLDNCLNRNVLETALFVLKERLNNGKNEVKKS